MKRWSYETIHDDISYTAPTMHASMSRIPDVIRMPSIHTMPNMNYEQHHEEVTGMARSCMKCGMGCIFALLAFVAIINSMSVYAGNTYTNATCYEASAVLPLNEWLIWTSAVALTSIMLVTTVLSVVLYYMSRKGNAIFELTVNGMFRRIMCEFVAIGIIYGIIAVAHIVLLIIGIVELVYQFPGCKTEVPEVCAIAIAIIIVNLSSTGITIS